jgi:gas vesicle protein
MKVIVAFVFGVLVGAVAALMLAPESGEELRTHLLEEGRREQERVKAEYEKNAAELRNRLDKLQTDIQSMRNRASEAVEEVTDSAEAA